MPNSPYLFHLYTSPFQTYSMNMDYIKRHCENKINRLLDSFPCVVIIGARQCGKTSISKGLRPDWKYYDLENPQTYDKIHDDLNFFFGQNPSDIIIDEAQLSGDLFRALRGVIDNDRESNGRFILTGSSSLELIKNVSESLAGRVAIFELSPFMVSELNKAELPSFYNCFDSAIGESTIKKLKALTTDLKLEDVLNSLVHGGYPQPVQKKNDSLYYKTWMENYFRTYVERDVRALFPKLDSIKYRRFVNMLTAHSGTIINRSQFGRSLDVNESTIKKYLDIADGTMIWRSISSYEKSKVKSIIKMPKGIFRDSGLCNYLQSVLDFEKLHNSSLVGQNFESFIIEEIIRGFQATDHTGLQYSYYRTKNGSEVDFIIEGEFGTLPIEIKYGSSTRAKQLTGLSKFLKENELPLGILVNNASEIEIISDNIIQVPSVFL